MIRALFLFAVLSTIPAQAWTLRATGLGGWTAIPLTIHYNLSGCTLPDADLLAIIDGAIAVWNTSQNTKMRVVRASAPVTATAADVVAGTATPTPVIVCDTAFTANQTADGDFIPALTRLAASSSHITFAGIVLNAETGKQADIAALTTAEVSVALTHEMGHALGLGHSGDSLALMYYSISGKASALLTQDDMDGIAYLYPRNEFSGGLYGCASVHRSTHGARLPGVIFFFAFFLGLNLLLGRFWVSRVKPKPLL